MHMKHVRHTLYSVELLPENMPTKESRISVKGLMHVVCRFMITLQALLHVYTYVIYIVIKILPYVCNNNNFILSPSILTCLFCINHAYTRILNNSEIYVRSYTQQLYIPPISGSRLRRLKAPFLHIIYGCPQ